MLKVYNQLPRLLPGLFSRDGTGGAFSREVGSSSSIGVAMNKQNCDRVGSSADQHEVEANSTPLNVDALIYPW